MPSPAERILVRGVNWLGDAVMTTPALARLREARPSAEIVLLTPAKLAGLWIGHPAVDRVLTFGGEEGVWSVARRLREERFARALILPNSPRSALEPFLAGIPERVGVARPWRRWLLTRAVPARAEEVRMHKRTVSEIHACIARSGAESAEPLPSRAHHLYQYLHLVAAWGAKAEPLAPCIAVGVDEVNAVGARFAAGGGEPGRPLIGINPGAEYGPAKRWPAERFAAAAVSLAGARSWNCRFWVLGGPGDRELAETVAARVRAEAPKSAGHRVHCLAGQTSLRELCAALKACDVVLTNDTGPMHVAAAVGTPVVVPFGSTSWRLTGPGLPGDGRHRFLESSAPCSPCFLRECPIDLRCMTGISVETVVAAVEAVLAGRRDVSD